MENKEHSYLDELIENLEQCRQEGRAIPFRVEKMLDQGFLVKVGGLFSFVPFNRMPWNYFKFPGAWAAVFPTIEGKRFFCKIERIEKEPLKVFLDTGAHRFGKFPWEVGKVYTGIVVQETVFGFFVDLGLQFDWKYGSCVCLLHRSAIRRDHPGQGKLALGKVISLTYFGHSKKGPILDDEARACFLREIAPDMVGQLVPVYVLEQPGAPPVFRVKGKFNCDLPINKRNYPGHHRDALAEALAGLKGGKVLLCEVVSINFKDLDMVVKWVASYTGQPPLEGLIGPKNQVILM